MMDFVIYLIGIAHITAYAVFGTLWLIVQLWGALENRRRMLGVMMAWYVAKSRWGDRHERGLTDSEWKRGEPKPKHYKRKSPPETST